MMATPTQPLRIEHRELAPQIERLRVVADLVGDAPGSTLRHEVDDVYDFLTQHLIPHAQAEERALYPVVAEVMGAPAATATMSRDHVEIGRLITELGSIRSQLGDRAPTASVAKDLRRILYGLSALVTVHFAKEEDVYLPILDAKLTAERAHLLFAAMEKAAHEARLQATR